MPRHSGLSGDELLLERERGGERDDQLEQRRERVDQGRPDRRPEIVGGHEVGVVLEAFPARLAHERPLVEAHPDALEERHPQQQHHERRGRQQEQDDQPALLGPAHGRALRMRATNDPAERRPRLSGAPACGIPAVGNGAVGDRWTRPLRSTCATAIIPPRQRRCPGRTRWPILTATARLVPGCATLPRKFKTVPYSALRQAQLLLMCGHHECVTFRLFPRDVTLCPGSWWCETVHIGRRAFNNRLREGLVC